MANANLALRFILELAAFAAAGFAVYQWTDGASASLRWLLAFGAALAVIGIWGFVVAPRRRNGLSQAQKDVIGSIVLLVVAAALGLAGQPLLAIGFGVLIVLNAVLLFVFGQDVRARFDGR